MSVLKLDFVKEKITYRKPVLRESKSIEETAEAIITDRCPDITEILCTSGMLFIRGQEAMDGMLTVSAGVSATALAAPEGRNTPEVVEVYIPLSLRFESSALTGDTEYRISGVLKKLDGHLVNPRRVLIRATVEVTVWGAEPCTEEVQVDVTQPEVQRLRGTLPLRLLKTTGHTTDTAQDEIAFPGGAPAASQLASCQITLESGQSRLAGGRAVFRGTARMDILYLTEEGKPERTNLEIPYAQFVDVGDCQDEDELTVDSCLAGADVELMADGSGVNVTLQVRSQVQVYGNMELHYLADLYATDGVCSYTAEDTVYNCLLDQRSDSLSGHGRVTGNVLQVVAAWPMAGSPVQKRDGENVEITVPVTVQVLYENDSGALCGGVCRTNLTTRTQMAPECRCEVLCQNVWATALPGGDGAEVRVGGQVQVSAWAENSCHRITEGELHPAEEPPVRPSLVIHRVGQGDTLWSLGKAYGTTVEAIEAANGLAGEATEGSLLLIPRRKAVISRDALA